jgi:CheY-like chemotaxis protein
MHVVTLRIRRPTSSILIIDDNQGLVKLLRRYLSDQACQVVHADNGREGLHAAQDMIPDAIILDVMMPEMDGWEFLQRLRNHPKTADVPVIICSVVNDPDLAYSLGASVVLEKPVSRRIILEAMAELDLI